MTTTQLEPRPTEHAPPRVRRGDGPRTRARRERRRRRRRWLVGAPLLVLLVVAGVVAGPWVVAEAPSTIDRVVGQVFDREGSAAAPEPVAPPPAPGRARAPLPFGDDAQPTLTVVTSGPDGVASHVAVIGVDPDGGPATALLTPADLVVDVPGAGLTSLARAWGLGGAELVELSLEGVLGIEIDGAVTVDADDWGVDLLATGEPGASGMQTAARAEKGLRAFARTLGDDGVASALPVDGRDAAVLDAYARAVRDGRADGWLVPVVPFGDDGGYRADAERLAPMVEARLGASVPRTAVAEGLRLQILNGVGAPGLGRVVAERATPLGFDVVLAGNAATFDVTETRVLVFDDDPDTVAAARALRKALGVGVVERSLAPQSVADVTVVVGGDLVR